MSQTEECATKRVFSVIIWYNDVVGSDYLIFFAGITVFSPVAGLPYILIIHSIFFKFHSNSRKNVTDSIHIV